MSSPRLVLMRQRSIFSSQAALRTSVWNRAFSSSLYLSTILRQWAWISMPSAYFLLGMYPVSSSSGM